VRTWALFYSFVSYWPSLFYLPGENTNVFIYLDAFFANLSGRQLLPLAAELTD